MIAAAGGIGSAGVLAACAGVGEQAQGVVPTQSAAPVTVRVVTDFGNQLWIDTTKEAFEVFERENPSIKVDITHGLGGAYIPKLTGMLASGDVPDVMRFIIEWYREFAARGDFHAIDGYLTKDKEVIDDQIPALLQLCDFKGSALSAKSRPRCSSAS